MAKVTRDVICLPFNGQKTMLNYNKEPEEYKPDTYKRKYTQNWPAYNLGQTRERMLALKILSEVVDSLGIKTYGKSRGRPTHHIKSMMKCCILKVYNGYSARRTIYDLELAHAKKYILKIPHFNSVLNYMKNPGITPWLHEIIRKTAIPLVPFEKRFAIDATGFSTCNKDKWVKVRLDKAKHRDYKKLHNICGTNTNTVACAEVSDGTSHEGPYFKKLINRAAKDFIIKEISADPGYFSHENAKAAEEIGAKPFIMLKKNTNRKRAGLNAYGRMVRFFDKHEALFRSHYHLRSNSESTHSMIKRKFGDYVRSKDSKAQENEVLCKVICHNIAVLVSAIFELKLDLEYLR